MSNNAIGSLSSLMQKPVIPVVGLLLAAGSAKAGCGACAATVIAGSVSTYFGFAATSILTRNLGTQVARFRPNSQREPVRL